MELGFWKNLKKPIMVTAPMSGVSDEAFRLMLAKYGKPDVFWTEFISADGLVSKGKQYCLKTLSFDLSQRPIIAQVFGNNPEYFKKTAELIAELGFDGIDINMGCPDKNVEKNGGGADLIKNPKLVKKIIKAVKKGAKDIPISVKTRIGYEKNEIDTWIKTILKEEPAVLTVHFRTRNQKFAPPVKWELAKEVIKLRDKYSPQTLIIGNGDVKSLEQAKQIIKETGLDGIMVGRALIGNPWFFANRNPDAIERLNATIEHAKLFEKCESGKHFNNVKKHLHSYLKGFDGAKELREKIMEVKNASEVEIIIKDFLQGFDKKI